MKKIRNFIKRVLFVRVSSSILIGIDLSLPSSPEIKFITPGSERLAVSCDWKDTA